MNNVDLVKELYENFKWDCPCELTINEFEKLIDSFNGTEKIFEYYSDEQLAFFEYVGDIVVSSNKDIKNIYG